MHTKDGKNYKRFYKGSVLCGSAVLLKYFEIKVLCSALLSDKRLNVVPKDGEINNNGRTE